MQGRRAVKVKSCGCQTVMPRTAAGGGIGLVIQHRVRHQLSQLDNLCNPESGFMLCTAVEILRPSELTDQLRYSKITPCTKTGAPYSQDPKGIQPKGLNILISTSTSYVCADGFQGLSKAYHYPIQLLTVYLLLCNYLLILQMLTETRDWSMFSSADLLLAAGKMRKN
jgi:hypothetical protein